MYQDKNIFCVWYPSGGFGHFIGAVLALHGKDFVRPPNTTYQFSDNGNSHSSDLTAPRFTSGTANYCFDFAKSNKKYVVLVDPGIDNETNGFIERFPNAQVLKVSYSAVTWPIVAYTSIHKAMESSIQAELAVDSTLWPINQNWAQREKYFLFLVEHQYRNMWQPSKDCHNLLVDELLDYQTFHNRLCKVGVAPTDFSDLWNTWFELNQVYIAPVLLAQQVVDAVRNRHSMDLSFCQDLWTQAVVNYTIWYQFGLVVPANDFADWFVSSDQIVALLEKNHALH
jgi:hypothetical protein